MAGWFCVSLDAPEWRVVADLREIADEPMMDVIVPDHEVDAITNGERQRHLSTLIKAGDPYPGGETAMSRAVGYPAAIAAEQVLDGKVPLTGVNIPVYPEIYDPVLDALAAQGIAFEERVEPIGS